MGTHRDGFFAFLRDMGVATVILDSDGCCAALDHWVPPTIGLADHGGFVERVRSAW